VIALPQLLSGSDRDKDAEILAPRHQVAVLQRQLGAQKVRFAPADRALLAALSHRLPRPTLRGLRLLARPDTILRLHSDLVARLHAAASRPRRRGRPRTMRSIRALVLRLAGENPIWGIGGCAATCSCPGDGRTLHGVADPAPGGRRSRARSCGYDLDGFPAFAGRCDAGPPTSSRRSRSPGSPVHPRRDRPRHPPRPDSGRNGVPDCRVGDPAAPQPPDGSPGCRVEGALPRQRPRWEVSGVVPRGPLRCGDHGCARRRPDAPG
jgi:hypothetical protein